MPALLYGAYGYTGELTARFAKERGLRLVLAGRDRQKTAEVAKKYGMDHRVFPLDDPRAMDDGLARGGPDSPRRPVLEDLAWAVLTGREFLFNH